MLPVTFGDLSAAARAVLDVPPHRARWVAARILAEAAAAAAFQRAEGRPHPRLGDGSVTAAALRRLPKGAPMLESPALRRAVRIFLDAMDARQVTNSNSHR